MDTFLFIFLSTVFLFVGVNFLANNRLNQAITTHLFHSDKPSSLFVRLTGIAIIASVILFVMRLHLYGITLAMVTILVFVYLSIDGRARSEALLEKKKAEMVAMHHAQISERKKELEKTRAKKIQELEESRDKPQSVANMKKKMWDDGSMTNRDLIRDLNKD